MRVSLETPMPNSLSTLIFMPNEFIIHFARDFFFISEVLLVLILKTSSSVDYCHLQVFSLGMRRIIAFIIFSKRQFKVIKIYIDST